MFEFDQTSETGLRIVLSTPSLEAGNVAALKSGFEKHCPEKLEEVVIEASEVDMIDSSGVGALLGIHKRLEEGNQVCLRNVKPTVLSVIELLRLHQVFKLERDEDKVAEAAAG